MDILRGNLKVQIHEPQIVTEGRGFKVVSESDDEPVVGGKRGAPGIHDMLLMKNEGNKKMEYERRDRKKKTDWGKRL